jgi:hypothetical protein
VYSHHNRHTRRIFFVLFFQVHVGYHVCHQPNNALNKMQLMISINLHVLAPGCQEVFRIRILHRSTRHTSHTASGPDLFGSQKSRHVCRHNPYKIYTATNFYLGQLSRGSNITTLNSCLLVLCILEFRCFNHSSEGDAHQEYSVRLVSL